MEHDLLAQKRTAYALGELDPAERAVIEADLTQSSAHRLEVEEVRALAAAVAGALATEKKPAMSEIQHLAIESTLQQLTEDHEAVAAHRLRRQRIAFWVPTSLAACALLASGITLIMLSQQAVSPIDSPIAPGNQVVIGGSGRPDAVAAGKARVNEVIKEYNQHIRLMPPVGVPVAYGPHIDVVATDADGAQAFHPAAITPLSTFPLQIDTSTARFIREFIDRGVLPPRETVHIEAMVNAYRYDDVQDLPQDAALAVKTEVSDCPWNAGHKLARVLVKARDAADLEAVVAQDVRVRVEFNPARVSSYRLIGYENRWPAEGVDYRDDRADLKAGHTLTVLYEIVPVGNFGNPSGPAADLLKYQRPPRFTYAADSDELFTVVLRFHSEDQPLGQVVEASAIDPGLRLADASDDFRFAAAVAQFGLVLLDSPTKVETSLAGIRTLADEARGPDATGDRARFIRLLEQAQTAVVVN